MTTPKFLTCVAVAALTLVGGAAEVVLSNVTAVPRYPWNGLVDIDFIVQSDEDATISLNVTRDGGRTVVVRNFWLEDGGTRSEERPITVAKGDHRIVWDAGIDLTNSISHDVTITLDAVVGSAGYMVVDLSGGSAAESWPVSYLSGVPAGGWSEEYRTERMVFALVTKGAFSMGSPETELGRDAEYETPHDVNLTNSFYTAVFEVTQRQYYLMTGMEPSYFDPRDDRPVDSVTWTEAVAALEKMKAKTGLEFRLPTEAEWEYACRGGTVTALSNGKNLEDEYFDTGLDEIANSYGANFVESVPVGCFAPNNYGLYDMLGNVSEWCQDGFAPYEVAGDSVDNPLQEDAAYGRVLRGGDCWSFAYACRSASRAYADPEDICPNVGFRAVLTGTSEGSASSRESATVDVLDTRPSPRFVTAGSVHPITYSPKWKAGGAKCEVSGEGSAGPTTETGSFTWTAPAGETGLFASFVLSIDSVPLYTATFSVLPTDAVAEDRSVINEDLTVPVGLTVVVSSSLTIPAGKTVTLAPGAVLKLASGVKVTVEDGGHLIANGTESAPVVITHINDDTVGAIVKTDPDGKDRPVYGAYEIVGEVTQNDFTEFRYVAAQPLPAVIKGETVLRRGRIYTAASTVTVQQGATLTIQPGVTLKFAKKADLKVDGALVAQGTATENIVFTALNDDDWGGDTDGDSGLTKPNSGAWGHVEVAGSASFTCCRVLYASDMTDEGAIHVVGGTATFDNGEIAHAEYECVRVNSGMFTSKNSVFRDAAIAFGYYGGTGVYVNNGVVADVTEVSRGINKHFFNTVFYRCLKFVSANNECRYCAFYNPANYGPQTAGEWTDDETKHCIWGDPKFVDNGLTPYALGNGSVCIDAADGEKAPSYDAFGRPRMNVLEESARRGNPKEGVYPDIGIFEADGSAAKKANLVVGSLTVPGTTSVGSLMEVKYSVSNNSETSVKAGTAYRDTVSFVAGDGTSTIEAKVFNTEVGASAFSAGEQREFTRSVPVPVLLGGDWSVRVVVNSARDLLESSYDDNVANSAGNVHVEMASNRLDEETRSAVSAGHPVTLKYDTGASTLLHIVEISAPEGATVRYGFGFTPSAQSSTGSAVIDSEGGKTIVSLPAGQTVYIIVESDRAGVVVANPKTAQMEILAVSPNVVARDRASLALDGQLFGEDATVVVASEGNPGSAKPAESVKWISPERVLVTCDFSAFGVGQAILTLTSGGSEAQAPVTVMDDVVDPELEVSVVMPDSLRQGRSFTFRVNYTNKGGANMDAPILRIISPDLTFTTPYGEYPGEVKLVALGDRGEDGVLRPGVTYGMDVAATVSTDPGSSGYVDHSIVTLTKTTAGASGQLPRTYFLSGDVNSDETTRVAAKLGETWETFFDGFSKFLTARGAYGLAVADFEVMAHDYARHLLAEVRSSGGQGLDSADKLREQKAANLATYGGDYSSAGTLWLYKAGEWVKLLEDAGTLTSDFKPSWPVVLVAHGNLETFCSPRVQRLAQTIDDFGLWPDGQKANVIAVDWGSEANRDATSEELAKMYDIASGSAVEFAWMGEISKELRARIGEVEFGFASARDIPAIADKVRENLGPVLDLANFEPTNAVFVGWGHGAHLLGAVAATCKAADKKIGRLVLLEPSGVEQFAFVAARFRYPQAWNLESADVIESYKTTPWASNGASAKEGAGQILGHFNFNVVPDRDASGKTAYFDGRGIRADNGLIVGNGMLGYLLHADADNIEARLSRARSLDCVRWFTDTVIGYGVDFEYGGWCGVGWSWMPEGSPAKFALPHEGYHSSLTNYPHAFHALIRERRRAIELLRPLELDDTQFYPWRQD